ncbi:SDR family NAD(P)-dependent oxidoreductase [Micromonospora okii]|uniref:SDR family NAD(P)-dependent oxidoreductase n=1 Tax=Micromonospora okii TaxID=1182970 RepID=UPI001E2B83C2|nr:SDR family oxidoreductase [Micromonospora okii]
MRFQDRVVVVTGAASGLGEATARRFAAEGARVAIADIDAEGARRVAGELPDALAVTVDVGDAASVEQAVADIMQRYGRIDVIFNNAGTDGEQRPLHEIDVASWERARRINGDGVFFVLKYGIEAMLRGDGGAIVNSSSITALAGLENVSPHTFTKAGVAGLTRSTAVEYAARGIRVNAVAPTAVNTPMVQHFIDDASNPSQARRQMETFNPKPGIPTPDDVAAVVLFLASDDASWITGHTIPVDGGYVAR